MGVFSRAVARLTGRHELPPGFGGDLDDDERVLASAGVAGGGHVVVTSWGVWLPGDAPRRIGWHLISKATWSDGTIVLVEAEESGDAGGAMLIIDRPPRRLRLAEPGRVPEVVHQRVTGSIRSRHYRDLPGGGAWFLQRKVPGRDGTVLQVRADPGTGEAAVRQVAADVAGKLRLGGTP